MPLTREQICKETSQKLNAALPALSSVKATIGLDGFVDEIIAVVDKRTGAKDYTTVDTIAAFGSKISKAAGQSSNYELVVKQQKLGGNGPIMANALASFGLSVTYIGSLGLPAHQVFDDFGKRAKIISIAEAGHTDALEFADGKLMLGKLQGLDGVTWKNLVEKIGKDALAKMIDASKLISTNNWTMLGHMTEIWSKIDSEILPFVSKQDRTFFIRLGRPGKAHARRHPERAHNDGKHAGARSTSSSG